MNVPGCSKSKGASGKATLDPATLDIPVSPTSAQLCENSNGRDSSTDSATSNLTCVQDGLHDRWCSRGFPALRKVILGVVLLDVVAEHHQKTLRCVGSVAGVFVAVTEQLRGTLLSGVNEFFRASDFHL